MVRYRRHSVAPARQDAKAGTIAAPAAFQNPLPAHTDSRTHPKRCQPARGDDFDCPQDMIAFCPTCANLLQIEKVGLSHHYVCQTCPYIYAITKTLSKEVTLKEKKVDDVLGGEEAWKNVQKTQTTCPACEHHEAYFREIQTRSADEPATIFYRCAKCEKTWKEG